MPVDARDRKSVNGQIPGLDIGEKTEALDPRACKDKSDRLVRSPQGEPLGRDGPWLKG